MNCPEAVLIAGYVRGELAAAERLSVEEHIDACGRCLAAVGAVAAALSADGGGHSRRSAAPGVWSDLASLVDGTVGDGGDGRLQPAGTVIGHYRLESVIGRGGMSVVYRAVNLHSGRRVALKVTRDDAGSFAGIRHEVAFLKSARYPGVVEIIDYDLTAPRPWYAMELLEGETLADRNGSLWAAAVIDAPTQIAEAPNARPPGTAAGRLNGAAAAAAGRLIETLTLFGRLCQSLMFVHRAGIVHCDLKPANIFIRSGDEPMLMDFGLVSRAAGAIGREALEVGGRIRGTLPYISPEVIRGAIPDARADLYAVGCMLYESVTGRPPFWAADSARLLELHLDTAPVPASQVVRGVPPALDQLLLSLLAKRPEDRMGDVADVAEALVALGAQWRAAPVLAVDPLPPAYLLRPRIVGRDDVLERLETLRREVGEGRWAMALIGGESGIGKTFLASELARRATLAGFDIVTGECQPLAASAAPTREVAGAALESMRGILQRAVDRWRSAPRETADAVFGSRMTMALLADYEPTLRQLVDEDPLAVPPLSLPPPAARERVLRALAEVLRGLVEARPLLLVIDDLQWADDLSLAFLRHLGQQVGSAQRLLIVGTFRSEEVTAAIAELRDLPGTHAIELGRLNVPALGAMIGDLLSMRPPDDLVRFLSEQSEGNPFFVAEYLRTAAAEGLLRRIGGHWQLGVAGSSRSTPYHGLPLPVSLRALLARRLSSLIGDAQNVAEAAAVLGREIDPGMLEALSGMQHDRFLAGVDDMIAKQVIAPAPGRGLRFLHDKLREVAYAGIPPERIEPLHRAAATIIEAAHAGTPQLADHYAALAHHLRLSGQPTRAVDYLEKAGERALRDSASADVVRFLTDARDLSAAAQVPPRRIGRWHRYIGDALQGVGDLMASQEHLTRAIELLGWPMPKNKLPLVAGVIGRVMRQILHRLFSARFIGKDAGELDALLEGARAYDRLQQVLYYTGQYLPLLFANLSTLNLTERAAASPERAAAYTNAGAAAGIVPWRGLAETYFRLAKETVELAPAPAVESYVHLLESVYRLGTAAWSEAEAATDRAMALAAMLRFPRRWEEAVGVRAGLELARGRFDQATEWCDRLLASARARQDAQMICWGLLNRTQVLTTRGLYPEADSVLGEVEPRLGSLGRPEQVWALALRARLSVWADRWADAESEIDRAMRLIAEAKPIHVHCVDAYARVAAIALALWRRPSTTQEVRRRGKRARAACSILSAAARVFPIAIPRHCLYEGLRRASLGQHDAALERWNRGMAEARRMDLEHDIGLLAGAIAHSSRSRQPRSAPELAIEGLPADLHLHAADLQLWG